ncbi:MAG: Asp-tRNA(Asn)/Glu-tRNA(Gln) amidotransferase subunit GatC [Alphaproteobacteria bacterium]|nr:Asp-tRNA(Asn)/Glu-tRNA(Gln) amidotransferase subunit GatC [Alphaproteobacteria bacterium]TAD86675.1 MAG: Asp-tRNA(Asn)/Glu-tRNA(Gln) amidotransferase subunit GatC [Alphaproteobacteria bacterium]
MALDQKTVARVAMLARIKVTEADLPGLATELSGILGWIEQLQAVDTSDVEPMTSVADLTLPMREDVVTVAAQRDAILANGPEANESFFTVPKVVE